MFTHPPLFLPLLVRPTQAFQSKVEGHKNTKSGNELTMGPPLRTCLFEPEPSKPEEEVVQRYTDKLIAEIEKLETDLKGISLDCRVAFLLPPGKAKFMTNLREQFSSALRTRHRSESKPEYALIDAACFAQCVGRGGEDSTCQQLVMDTVDNFDGLESLITFGVHLDGPTSDLRVRSWLYRSITRAQMLFVLVNQKVEGGWLEWLQLVRHDPEKEFDKESERKKILPVQSERKISRFPRIYLKVFARRFVL